MVLPHKLILHRAKKLYRDWIASYKKRQCGDPNCHRWFTEGLLQSRNVGIHLNDSWYCSCRCLQAGAEEALTAALGSYQGFASSAPTRSVGIELVSKGHIRPEDFQEATRAASATGHDLGELLVEFGYANEAQVAGARAAVWGCPVYRPSPALPTPEIHIPAVLAEACSVLPMHYVPATRQLMLGFLHSVDYELMSALELMNHCVAIACIVPPSEFHHQRAREGNSEGSASSSSLETVVEATRTSLERALILCKHCASLGANHVTITLCRDFLWARSRGGTNTGDLLFRLDCQGSHSLLMPCPSN